MSTTVTILGSTGSIGISTLRVIRSLDEEFKIYGLSCHKSLSLFEEQISEFHPEVAAVSSKLIAESEEFKALKYRFPEIEFLIGEDGIIDLSCRNVNILVSAIVGSAGLKPSMSALPYVDRIALANKETLVMAGDIFITKTIEYNVELIPIDSEHNAIFSMLRKIELQDVKRIILTASGGSLRNCPVDKLCEVTPEEALNHPTWDMGDKITIDSATLMNKGLEVIEAHHLFNIDYESIDVIMHPESIIHSMVETVDGAIYAYMSVADMALPIFNALTYPTKRENIFAALDIVEIGKLNFYASDSKRHPALKLCYDAGIAGGTMPAVLNAANEIAVMSFLKKDIIFSDIIKVVENTISLHDIIYDPDIDEILYADTWARETAKYTIRGFRS